MFILIALGLDLTLFLIVLSSCIVFFSSSPSDVNFWYQILKCHCGEFIAKVWHNISFIPRQPTPTSKFLQGYVGAVTSAVSIAVSVFLGFSVSLTCTWGVNLVTSCFASALQKQLVSVLAAQFWYWCECFSYSKGSFQSWRFFHDVICNNPVFWIW